MTFMKKCIDNLLPKNKQPWTATSNKALTMFLVTDDVSTTGAPLRKAERALAG